MCILVTAPRRDMLPLEYIPAMLEANNDGAGFAAWDPKTKRCVIRKFLTTTVVTHPAVSSGAYDIIPAEVATERLDRVNKFRIRKGLAPWTYRDIADPSPELLSIGPSLTGDVETIGESRRKIASMEAKPAVTYSRHTVSTPEVIAAIEALPAESPIIFHARVSTHGGVSLANVHPFKIPKSDAILAHNGVISGMGTSEYMNYRDRDGADARMSDTRDLCDNHLAGMSFSAIKRAHALIDHIGGWSKFAIIHDRTGEIFRFGDKWAHIDENGVAYSNLSWMSRHHGGDPTGGACAIQAGDRKYAAGNGYYRWTTEVDD